MSSITVVCSDFNGIECYNKCLTLPNEICMSILEQGKKDRQSLARWLEVYLRDTHQIPQEIYYILKGLFNCLRLVAKQVHVSEI